MAGYTSVFEEILEVAVDGDPLHPNKDLKVIRSLVFDASNSLKPDYIWRQGEPKSEIVFRFYPLPLQEGDEF
jgi:hypothetical protein